ncbi:MAG: hypothetical protein M3032_07060, partial [Verrucomicrobiota bacterium]|nr:hypothetical protein [Verrucomicrobiota bacterium]
AGEIDEETALLYASNKSRMRRDLDHLAKQRGTGEPHAPSGLKLRIPEAIDLSALAAAEIANSTSK